VSKDRQERGKFPPWWMIIGSWVLVAAAAWMFRGCAAKHAPPTKPQDPPAVIEQPVVVPIEKPATKPTSGVNKVANSQKFAYGPKGTNVVVMAGLDVDQYLVVARRKLAEANRRAAAGITNSFNAEKQGVLDLARR